MVHSDTREHLFSQSSGLIKCKFCPDIGGISLPKYTLFTRGGASQRHASFYAAIIEMCWATHHTANYVHSIVPLLCQLQYILVYFQNRLSMRVLLLLPLSAYCQCLFKQRQGL